jgi:hypothetical protein
LLPDPINKQKKAFAVCGRNKALHSRVTQLYRSVLAAGIENPFRVEGLFESAVQAFAHAVEGVEDWDFSVAMAEKYGMSSDFCDLFADIHGAAASVNPALGTRPIGQDLVFAIEAGSGRR